MARAKGQRKTRAAHEPPATPGGLRFEYQPVHATRPDPANEKDHDVEGIAEAMAEFGVMNFAAINEQTGLMLYGHGRRESLLEAEAQGEPPPANIIVGPDGRWAWPVIRGLTLEPDRARRFRLADNRLVEKGGWNAKALLASLKQAAKHGGLGATGFTSDDVRRLQAVMTAKKGQAHDRAIDPADALRRKWGTRVGDTWLVASASDPGVTHVVVCGDSTQAATYRRALGGNQRARVVFTDPPYGIAYSDKGGRFGTLKGDAEGPAALSRLVDGMLRSAAKFVEPDAAWYLWTGEETRDVVAASLRRADLRIIVTIVWAKPGGNLSWAHYAPAHETALYAARTGRTPAWYGEGETTVWDITQGDSKTTASVLGSGVTLIGPGGDAIVVKPVTQVQRTARRLMLEAGEHLALRADGRTSSVWRVATDSPKALLHPTQKPVELAARALQNSSRPGESVLDPFCGSGSTIVACEVLGRQGIGIDLEPKYVAATLQRLAEMGLKPERAPSKPSRGGR